MSTVPTLFPTTVVGSLPRPHWVLDLFQRKWSGAVTDQEFNARLDSAVLGAIQLQEMAGVDIITDGEYRRESYVKVFAERTEGFERDLLDGYPILDDGSYYNSQTRQVMPYTQPTSPLRYPAVVRKIKYDKPIVLDEARFLLANTKTPAKVTLPSPYILARRLWHPNFSRDAYPTRAEFMESIIGILRKEVLALKEMGAYFIQLDDPWLSLFVDTDYRKNFPNVEAEIDLSIGAINRVFEGVSGVKTGVHFCRAHYNRLTGIWGNYEFVMPHLHKLKVSQLVMEFALPNAGGLDVLKGFPKDKELGLGCVDVRAADIPTAEGIAAMVREAAKHVGRDRITLNPDCGFAPSNTNPIPVDEAYLKLKAMAEAGRLLRGA